MQIQGVLELENAFDTKAFFSYDIRVKAIHMVVWFKIESAMEKTF